MEVQKGFRAVAKHLPMSPSKIRPIADHVRRKSIVEATAILKSMPNKSAALLLKVVSSAAANAMYHNQNLDEESLYIAELLVDGGPSRKTMWPRSHGRADRLIKRTSHISVTVEQKAVS